MPWNIVVHDGLGVVETQYSGVIPGAELAAAVTATINTGKREGMRRFLGDCTELAGGHSAVDLYGLAELLQAAGVAAHFKEAILVPQLPSAMEDVRFWETACYNRGLRVRIFEDRQQALDWLAEP